MQKFIAVITGQSKSGKTDTVKAIHDLYKQKLINANYKEKNLAPTMDREILFTYTNEKGDSIGFSSHGDIPEVIFKYLNMLKDCRIIIAAARLTQKPFSTALDFADNNGYTIYPICKIKYDQTFVTEIKNDEKCAIQKLKIKLLNINPFDTFNL